MRQRNERGPGRKTRLQSPGKLLARGTPGIPALRGAAGLFRAETQGIGDALAVRSSSPLRLFERAACAQSETVLVRRIYWPVRRRSVGGHTITIDTSTFV